MQTLYIDRKETRLVVDRQRLIVHSENLNKPLSIALSYLSSIVISAKTQLDSSVLLACAGSGISVIILDAKSYERFAQYLPPSTGVVQRKIKQFEILQHMDTCLDFAKQLVISVALQQLKLLHFWKKNMQLSDADAEKMIVSLRKNLRNINTCDNMEQLRGLEGNSAKIIFSAIGLIAPKWCKFTGRNRRPPLDPINVLLSLSYSLMYAECSRVLTAHALDPMLGFFHDPLHGRHSLACDLNERLRVEINKWVMKLLHEQQLQAYHFSESEKYPCILSKEGRAIFYPLWQKKFKVWKKYIRLIAQQWAKKVDETTYDYTSTYMAM